MLASAPLLLLALASSAAPEATPAAPFRLLVLPVAARSGITPGPLAAINEHLALETRRISGLQAMTLADVERNTGADDVPATAPAATRDGPPGDPEVEEAQEDLTADPAEPDVAPPPAPAPGN